MWNAFIITPIANLFLWVYAIAGNNMIISIIVVTIIFRLLMSPVFVKMQTNQLRQMALRPAMLEIKEKYKDDKAERLKAQKELFKKNNVDPTMGCTGQIVQYPIFLALYQGFQRVMALTPLSLLELSQTIYNTKRVSWGEIIPVRTTYWWLDLTKPDPYYILPLLLGLTVLLAQRITRNTATMTETEAKTAFIMNVILSIMLTVFALNYPAGLSVYILSAYTITSLQMYLVANKTRVLNRIQKSKMSFMGLYHKDMISRD